MTSAEIIQIVADKFDVPQERVRWYSRKHCFVRPRFAAYKLLRERLGLSYSLIAYEFGERRETAPIHGIKRADELMKSDEDFRTRYEQAAEAVQ